jgi:predicted porin
MCNSDLAYRDGWPTCIRASARKQAISSITPLLFNTLAIFLPLPALAGSGNATFYGEANLSLDRINSGNTALAQETTTNRVSSNASRIGLRGDEDLGGGLHAIWQIESKVNMDSGVGNFGTRNTFAGLKNAAWGELVLGRHDTPYKSATRCLYIFGDTIGGSHALMGGAVKGKNSALAFAARKNNLLEYDSPSWGGLTVQAAYSAGAELAGPATIRGHSQSLAAIFDSDPWNAILAYQANDIGGNGTGDNAGSDAAGVSAARESAWKLGLGYDFGKLEMNLVYERTRDNINTPNSVYTCTSASDSTDCYGHHTWFMAGKYKLAGDAIKLAHVRSSDLGDGSAAASGASQWVAGYEHRLSKRTLLQITYSKLFNNDRAAFGIGSNDGGGVISATGAGADPSAWSFGMKHIF